jgi:muconolactone delta-isomerase
MEYLVTMTTHVPDGTPDKDVQDMRAREAAHSRELAAEGHLARLWRPPLQPGEWRTLGLFAAENDSQLETILTSMPLRTWRTDEVTPLRPHPNDPISRLEQSGSLPPDDRATEFLTMFTVTVPAGTPADAVATAITGEANRTRELAQQGHLRRLWTLPGQGRALGLWRAHGTAVLTAILASLPLNPWLSVQTTPLTPHPNDPAQVID